MTVDLHDPIANAGVQESTHEFAFRTATLDDVGALQQMIGDSLRALAKGYYTQPELDGSIGYLFGPDTVLIHDQTYFILYPRANPSTICACGGWSFRKTLYGGDSAPSPLRMPAKRDPLTDRASIRAIFTHPAWARRGLGTMMMRHCEARAREGKVADGGNAIVGGFKRLEMGATLSGVVLYERCGYLRSGRIDVVRCPNGEGIKVVHMVKDLEIENPVDDSSA
ncbi:acyl-CoA N-acyltransferase [Phaeosphaeria sp. MPI-PUGE-AT-0046c]|nr:acyl-CoA N-acyltransferase [Phaeosphaeria sp. MPI-PUGE-AT-0046c]